MNKIARLIQQNINFNEVQTIVIQGIKEYIYNFSKTYDYETVFAFVFSMRHLSFSFEIGVEYDIEKIAELKGKNAADFWHISNWLYYRQFETLAPIFVKKWQVYKEKILDIISQVYGLKQETMVEDIFFNKYKAILIAAEQQGIFTFLTTTNYFQIAIQKNKMVFLEQQQQYLLKPITSLNTKALISLPHDKDLEAMLYQDIENFENWLVYADWLQTEQDIRGELIYLSILYQKKHPNHNIETILKQSYSWPKSEYKLLERLALLHKQKWQFLPPEVAHIFFRKFYINGFTMQWQYGFIYFVKFEYGIYESVNPLYNLLQSDTCYFLYSLELSYFEDIETLYKLLSFIHASLRKLFISYFFKSILDPNILLKNTPYLNQLTLNTYYPIQSFTHNHITFLSLNILAFPKKLLLPKLSVIKLDLYLPEDTKINIEEKLSIFQTSFTPKNLPQLKIIKIGTIEHYSLEFFKSLDQLTILNQISEFYLEFRDEIKPAQAIIPIIKKWQTKIIITAFDIKAAKETFEQELQGKVIFCNYNNMLN